VDEPSDSTLTKLGRRYTLIREIAGKFDVNPLFLPAIIYTEQRLNYDWKDEAFDLLLFRDLGKNSSIGFCQVKIKTAYFIEYSFNHPGSSYYLGPQYEKLALLSSTPEQLIQKLVNDSLNICYAAAYMRMMQSRWSQARHSIDNQPEILRTLYSTGVYHADGLERAPRAKP
jgi:hypothetical protein